MVDEGFKDKTINENPSDNHYSPSLENLAWEKGDLIGFDCGDPEFPQPFLLGFVSEFFKIGSDQNIRNGLKMLYDPVVLDPGNTEYWGFVPENSKVLGLWSPNYLGFPREKASDFEVINPYNTDNPHLSYFVTGAYAGKEAVLEGLRKTDDLSYYADMIEKCDIKDLRDFVSSAEGNHRK